MARFKFSINVEPKDIPNLDDAHKRDCADMLDNAVNSTLKYTLIMTGAIMALFAVYSFFGFTWMLRMHYMLPKVSGMVPAAAIVIFIFEFISGMMKKWGLTLQLLFHVVMIFSAVTTVPTLVVVPFAIYGAVLHFKLITLLPWYNAISVLPGYPEFTPLPEKTIPPSDKKEDIVPQPDENKPEPVSEKQPETMKAEASDDNKPVDPEKQPETAEAETPESKPVSDENEVQEKHENVKKSDNSRSSGGSGKKKKRRKGKK